MSFFDAETIREMSRTVVDIAGGTRRFELTRALPQVDPLAETLAPAPETPLIVDGVSAGRRTGGRTQDKTLLLLVDLESPPDNAWFLRELPDGLSGRLVDVASELVVRDGAPWTSVRVQEGAAT